VQIKDYQITFKGGKVEYIGADLVEASSEKTTFYVDGAVVKVIEMEEVLMVLDLYELEPYLNLDGRQN